MFVVYVVLAIMMFTPLNPLACIIFFGMIRPYQRMIAREKKAEEAAANAPLTEEQKMIREMYPIEVTKPEDK